MHVYIYVFGGEGGETENQLPSLVARGGGGGGGWGPCWRRRVLLSSCYHLCICPPFSLPLARLPASRPLPRTSHFLLAGAGVSALPFTFRVALLSSLYLKRTFRRYSPRIRTWFTSLSPRAPLPLSHFFVAGGSLVSPLPPHHTPTSLPPPRRLEPHHDDAYPTQLGTGCACPPFHRASAQAAHTGPPLSSCSC